MLRTKRKGLAIALGAHVFAITSVSAAWPHANRE
jgi:hypothetical protein